MVKRSMRRVYYGDYFARQGCFSGEKSVTPIDLRLPVVFLAGFAYLNRYHILPYSKSFRVRRRLSQAVPTLLRDSLRCQMLLA